ncbi:MAG: PBP1A family penicillin-binding protein [Firmicutes bacterium]|nr:PBP1A family penicillin-binding protein [Bacillota bacterium]
MSATEPNGAAPRAAARRFRWSRAAAAAALLSLLLLLAAFVWPLPAPQLDQATILYGRDGSVVAELFRQNRTTVRLDQVPPLLRQAVVDTEDARFYQHGAFDGRGLARALVSDLVHGRIVEGGSTITQQLAKNLYLSNRRTLWRKLAEAVLALKLEQRYTKDQILEMYLNTVYFGHGAYGVEAASLTYFGRPVERLTPAQATLLAGLPQAPSADDPLIHPDAARERQQQVLARLVAAGHLAPEEAQAIARQPWKLAKGADQGGNTASDAFIDAVVRELGTINPDWADDVYRLGLRVDTTLDPAVQRAVETAVERHLVKGTVVDGVEEPQVAVVALDPATGAVRALLGSRDPHAGGFNRALDARRQPGSTFKAFLYAAVLERRHTLLETQVCEPVTFRTAGGAYTPRDDDPAHPYHYAPLSILRAVAVSDNVVAVKWTAAIGPAAVVDMARRAGITSPLQPTLSVALGAYGVTPLEMAAAYAVFDNGGYRVQPFTVVRVRDAQGRVLWERPRPARQAVLDPGVAYLTTYALRQVVTSGTGAGLADVVGRPVAGKTGTSDNQQDAWFVGYAPQLVTAVWVGNDQPAPLPGYGASLAGPVWANAMRLALRGQPVETWKTPGDVVWLDVSTVDGLLPNPTSPTMRVPFLKGTEPTQVSPAWDWENFWKKLQEAQSLQDLQRLLQPGGAELLQAAPDWLRAWLAERLLQLQNPSPSEEVPGGGSAPGSSETAPGGGSEPGAGTGGQGAPSGGSSGPPGATPPGGTAPSEAAPVSPR